MYKRISQTADGARDHIYLEQQTSGSRHYSRFLETIASQERSLISSKIKIVHDLKGVELKLFTDKHNQLYT